MFPFLAAFTAAFAATTAAFAALVAAAGAFGAASTFVTAAFAAFNAPFGVGTELETVSVFDVPGVFILVILKKLLQDKNLY